MKLGIAQLCTCAGDYARTSARIIEQSQQAASQKVDLLVFPMGVLTGHVALPSSEQRSFLFDITELLTQLATEVACDCLIPVTLNGTTRTDNPLPVHELFLLAKGIAKPLGLDAAMNAFVASITDDTDDDGSHDHVESEPLGIKSFTYKSLSFAAAYTIDEYYELLDQDYDIDALFFFPTQGYVSDRPGSTLGAALLENDYQSDIRDKGTWLIAVGSLGCYDTQVFTGGSFILAPTGALLASAPSFEEALISADVSTLNSLGTSTSLSESLEPELYEPQIFCWEALSMGVREFIHNLGYTDVVLALDGTINACALAVLACDALGPTHVHALMATPLAGVVSAKRRIYAKSSHAWRSLVDAAKRERSCRRLASNLRLELVERDARLVDVCVAAQSDAHGEEERLAVADLERGIIHAELATLAAKTSAALLSAHDKTYEAIEAAPGDSSAVLAPFGDIVRSTVIELAHARNGISPVLPDLTLAACDMPYVEMSEEEQTMPPARSGSTSTSSTLDTALMHAIDSILKAHIEQGESVDEIAADQDDAELVCAVLDQVVRHNSARATAPICLHLTDQSLDDSSLPLGFAWKTTLRTEELNEITQEAFINATRTLLHDYKGKRIFEKLTSDLFEDYLDEVVSSVDDSREGVVWKEEHTPAELSDASEMADGSEIAGMPSAAELAELSGYLQNLADELSAVSDGSQGLDGHIAADGLGNLSFGGFSSPGITPFSEN